MTMDELWRSTDEDAWLEALYRYWDFLIQNNHNLKIEIRIQFLCVERIGRMDDREWYDFLLNTYFVWKYTAPKRLVTTRRQLKRYAEGDDNLENLLQIRDAIFSLEDGGDNVEQALNTATQIRGLGTAGASGLLTVLFPDKFGTVDQFAVMALKQVPDLPEKEKIAEMSKRPDQLSKKDGVVLINIMREKARALNALFKTSYWTPRKIDMILWQYGR